MGDALRIENEFVRATSVSGVCNVLLVFKVPAMSAGNFITVVAVNRKRVLQLAIFLPIECTGPSMCCSWVLDNTRQPFAVLHNARLYDERESAVLGVNCLLSGTSTKF